MKIEGERYPGRCEDCVYFEAYCDRCHGPESEYQLHPLCTRKDDTCRYFRQRQSVDANGVRHDSENQYKLGHVRASEDCV